MNDPFQFIYNVQSAFSNPFFYLSLLCYGLIVWLILRTFRLWYWRINELHGRLQRIEENLGTLVYLIGEQQEKE